MYRLHRTFIPNCPDPYLSANENLRSPRIISNIWLRKRKPSSRVWKRNRRYEDWKRQNETNKDLRILIVTIFSKFNNNSPENRFWISFKKFFLSSFPIPIMWIDHRLERSKLYLLRKSAMFRVWCVYLRRKLGTATRELWIPLKLFPTPRYCNIAENGTAGCIPFFLRPMQSKTWVLIKSWVE